MRSSSLTCWPFALQLTTRARHVGRADQSQIPYVAERFKTYEDRVGRDERVKKALVWICGPPAVGKMTVGIELSEITGFPLFHNHLSIEAVLPVFRYGSPPFNRIVAQFRDSVFVEAARSDLRGLIYTMVWAFDHPGDFEFVQEQKAIFESHGGRVVFVELTADLETRLSRNASEPRMSAKPSKQDVEASRRRLLEHGEAYQLDSRGAFPFPDYLRIDNTQLAPRDVAERIAVHFGLPSVPADASSR